jgi:hypothetical protein
MALVRGKFLEPTCPDLHVLEGDEVQRKFRVRPVVLPFLFPA